MRGWALLAVLWAAPALAWIPGGYVPTSNWVSLVEAVRERREATWYGQQVVTNFSQVQTNQLYFNAPRDYAQHIRIDLGMVATSLWELSDFLDFDPDPVGPVICETNAAGGVTNIWCWTNWVSLSTDFVTYTNGGPFWGEAITPYGPQSATNLLWFKTDERLAQFVNAVPAWTAAPSRAVVAQIDTDLIEVIPRYVDVRLMEEVTGLSAVDDPHGLIDAYFATPIGTNWYWVNTNAVWGSEDLPEDLQGNLWMSELVYPTNLPALTVSNAWRWAGIEPYRYPSEIVTTSVEVMGWEVGQLTTYIAGTNIVRATNWMHEYTFTRAPTLTPWRVPLGQLRVAVTNAITSVTTNEEGRVTTITTNQLWPVASPSVAPPAWAVHSRHSPRLLGMESAPTNWLQITPPGTGEIWRALLEQTNWTVQITGSAALAGDVFVPSTEWSNVVEVSEFVWPSTGSYGRASFTNAAMQMVTNAATNVAYYTQVGPGGLSVSNWPIRTEVWSNEVLLATASVVGTTIDLWIEGTAYEHIATTNPPRWVLGTNDWSERARVAMQLRWMSTHPVNPTNWWEGYNHQAGAIGSGLGADRAANYFPEFYSTSCVQGDMFTANTCSGFPEMEAVAALLFTGYEPRGTNGLWPLRWEMHIDRFGQVYNYLDVFVPSNNASRSALFNLRARWPERVTLVGSNLTPRLSAAVDHYARVTRDELQFAPAPDIGDLPIDWWFFVPPSYPSTNTHSVVSRCGTNATTNTAAIIFASDILGADQFYARRWATVSKPTNQVHFAMHEVDYTGGIGLDSDALEISTLKYIIFCETEITETRFISRTTDRRLRSESYIVRWNFTHLASLLPPP